MACIGVVFIAVRYPQMVRQPGGQDEDYYAAPGWAILQGGTPRIPYVPSRDRSSVFYRADEALFTLPPAYFYLQAGVYWLIGPGYGQGRLTSAFVGLVAIGFVYLLGRRLFDSEGIGMAAAGVYSISRLFFFPATFARPDMLCATFGLGAILLMLAWRDAGRTRTLLAAGFVAGLGMLTHPFAIVFCVQIGVWTLIAAPPGRRLRSAALVTISALAGFAFWAPLILNWPDLFVVQFGAVFSRSGSGLVSRFLWPVDSMLTQARLFYEWSGPYQTGLFTIGLLTETALELLDYRKGKPPAERPTALLLAWSSVLLLVIFQGDHPAKGYWCYPGAFLAICVARSAAWPAEGLRRWGQLPTPAANGLCAAALLLIFLPGSGIRVFAEHLRHWSDPRYDRQRFVQTLLGAVPPNRPVLVDAAYVLDFAIAGRSPRLALNVPDYFQARGLDYEYLVVGPTGLEQELPKQLNARDPQSFGIPGNPFACYAEVYQSVRSPVREAPSQPDVAPQ